MPKILTTDELLDALVTTGSPAAERLKCAQEAVGALIAAAVADQFGIIVGPPSFEGAAMGGTASMIRPSYPGQLCPEPLAQFDPDEPFDTPEVVAVPPVEEETEAPRPSPHPIVRSYRELFTTTAMGGELWEQISRRARAQPYHIQPDSEANQRAAWIARTGQSSHFSSADLAIARERFGWDVRQTPTGGWELTHYRDPQDHRSNQSPPTPRQIALVWTAAWRQAMAGDDLPSRLLRFIQANDGTEFARIMAARDVY